MRATARRCVSVPQGKEKLLQRAQQFADRVRELVGASAQPAHRVPLSPPVVEILEGLARTDDHWVFPSPTVKGQRIRYSAKAMAKVREGSGVDFVAHDLRRTAASMMASAGVNRVVIGKILNHAEPGVTAVYDRHSYDPEKRAALDAWGQRVEQIVAGKGGADATDQE